MGGLVGGQAIRGYATRAANVTRSQDARQAAIERRQLEEAERIVDILGHMKGVAMKVGQIASVIDLEGLPPDARERFQQKLAALRDSAPRVSFKDMRKVIEDDLGERLENLFDETYTTIHSRSYTDATATPFIVNNLGVPRTFHVSYSFGF